MALRESERKVMREKSKQYYWDHRDELLAKAKASREADPERYAEYQRRWCVKNKPKRTEYFKKYYADHREKILAYHREYYQAHREELLSYFADRRRRRKADGTEE